MQTQPKIKKKFKRHFQLLEVMVAAFIILICAAPALKIFTTIYIEQRETIRENQRDHLAHLVFANVIEQLYKRSISIDDIMKGSTHEVNDPALVELLKRWSYEGTYSFSHTKVYTKKGEEHPSKYLTTITIRMNNLSPKKLNRERKPLDYDYEVYIDSGARAKLGDKEPPIDEQLNESEDENELLDDGSRFDGANETSNKDKADALIKKAGVKTPGKPGEDGK